MPNILDIYNDKSLGGLVNIFRDNPETQQELMPTELDYGEQQELPMSAFAWPEMRAYPMHNNNMAYLSSLYRNSYPPEYEDIEVPEYVDENLEKAAYLYDFKVPKRKTRQQIKEAKERRDTRSENASNPFFTKVAEEDYLLPAHKSMPVRTKDEGLFIQNLLIKNAHTMGYSDLSEASYKLVHKMASYDTEPKEINPVIYKYAGLTLVDKDLLEASILRRLDFADADSKPHYVKLAIISRDMDYNRANLIKVASTLETLDKKANMRRLYDRHIMNPIESVFNTTKIYGLRNKQASEGEFTPDMAERVTSEQIKNILGEDVYAESAGAEGRLDKDKLIEVINSLPKDMVTDFIGRI